MQNFRALEPRPQTSSLRQLGAQPLDLQDSPPIANVWLCAWVCIWAQVSTRIRGKKCSNFGKDFFFGLHLNSGKKGVPFLAKIFFFGLHLIYLPEKNRGRGSSPPILKIGQNWGKIANYPLQCSTKNGTPARSYCYVKKPCISWTYKTFWHSISFYSRGCGEWNHWTWILQFWEHGSWHFH